MAEGASTPTNDAHGREGHMLVMDQPPSSLTKSLGKAIQDNMTHIDMDDPPKPKPVSKKNQPPQNLSNLNDTPDHSPSRDEGLEHDLRAFNYGHDDNTHIGESSTTRSTGVVGGITSPRAAALAKDSAPKTKSLGKAVQVDPKTEENVNSLGKVSSWTARPPKTVRDAPDSAEDTLAVGRSWSKSRGKAPLIQGCDYDEEHNGEASSTTIIPEANADYDQENDGAPSSTKIVPKANAEAGPSVQAPSQHQDGVVAAIGGPAQANAPDVASNFAPAILAFPWQPDANVVNPAIGGGAAGVGPAALQPNAARQVPALAQFAVIAAAIPVPVLLPNPNPGVNNIDPLRNSGIRYLRNPADGDEGKLWDKLN